MDNSKLEKQANAIDKIIAEGRLKEEEIPLLVEHGLEQEIVDYWNARKNQKSLWEKVVSFFVG